MKAIVQDQFGPPEVLRLADIDPPEIGPGDVLVRVRAAGLIRPPRHHAPGRSASRRGAMWAPRSPTRWAAWHLTG